MPPIFKALATITAWVLFVWGCIGLVFCTVGAIGAGEMFGVPPSWQTFAGWGSGVMSLALSVVCMKLRQMLE